jgi:hypothetical protein
MDTAAINAFWAEIPQHVGATSLDRYQPTLARPRSRFRRMDDALHSKVLVRGCGKMPAHHSS